MLQSAALPFVASLLLSLLLVPLAIRLAPQLGFLDRPRADRAHTVATPRLGGAAVLLALAAATAPWAREIPPAIYAGAAIAAVVGIVDDRWRLPSGAKFLCQVFIALWIVWSSRGALGAPVLAAAVFWGVSLMNAANVLDNQDAALSAAAIPAALSLGTIGLIADRPVVAAGAFALAGALTGFLRYNKPPARIFLGDLGSLVVGFLLAALTLALARGAGSLPKALAPGFAVAYPLFDLTFVMITRAVSGRRVDVGGVDHTTHRLAARLGSVGKAAGMVAAVSFVFAVTAVARYAGGSWMSFAATIAIALAFFLWMGMQLLREVE